MARSAASPTTDNDVRLVGELEAPPQERTLRSGDQVVTFRLKVRRSATGESGSDSLECTARAARLRRSALTWTAGEVVEASGHLRRRFYRAGAASRPFLVVEVDRARRVR